MESDNGEFDRVVSLLGTSLAAILADAGMEDYQIVSWSQEHVTMSCTRRLNGQGIAFIWTWALVEPEVADAAH